VKSKEEAWEKAFEEELSLFRNDCDSQVYCAECDTHYPNFVDTDVSMILEVTCFDCFKPEVSE